ncbi:MAG TPA: pyridoxamine 5'-phosphate oxidase family protein [Polyangiaceae bacterium]|nr:pyridoxamine 5'-phosphate oxidase family protein [Polyangiaceae bacterium]
METGTREKLMGILKSFRNAMLVTQGQDKALRSRPMALLKVDDNGDCWFMTGFDSGKIDEIGQNPMVNVSLQDDRKFLSLSGQAVITRDRQKLEELWSEHMKVFFPRGKEDPNLALICVSPSEGEFWDNEGVQGLKFLLEAVKAYVTGTTPDVDNAQHGAVALNSEQTSSSR